MDATRLPRRPLGSSGLKVTPIGLAALSVGGPRRGLSPADVERAFYELGVNTFLVHPMMKDLCEGVRRLVRGGHRDELVIASEASIPLAGSVEKSLDKHLRALETDHLDVWLLGWVRKRWYVREAVWSEMQRERSAGKVRALGFSAHDRKLATELARELPVDVLMIRYNAAHRGAEREVFAEFAAPGRPGIIAYTATRWGMLMKPLPRRGFPEPMSGAECYRFVLQHPCVDLTWCAAGSFEELREDVEGALAGALPPERLEWIRRFGDAVHDASTGGRRWMFGSSAE
ncbi:MAG: aldo/keto reductase [Deltaproteobacteria bacterium]|nr:aldo/keto reductase [Deltaproteobacteria bacterium]